MAPSRALLRCAEATQLRRTPHMLSTTVRRIHSQHATTASLCTRSTPLIRLHPTPSAPLRLPIRRHYSQSSTALEAPDYLNEAELHVFNKIKAELEPVKLEVQDISGGCGSMYALEIVSPKFKGLSMIKQHKLVNSILTDEIKGWHGVRLNTKAPV